MAPTAPPPSPSPLARPVDLLLEAAILPSYTSIGFSARRALYRWDRMARPDLRGRTFLVTGASRGIGHQTASMLLAAGAAVRSVSHSPRHAEQARQQLLARHPQSDVAFAVGDLTDPADLDRFTADLRRDLPALDGIAHCAGGFYDHLTRTPDGAEANIALAVLTPHRLNRALIDLLAAAPHPRVVMVASSGAYLHRLTLPALSPADSDRYRPLAAYALAKRAQITLTHAWSRHQPTIAFDAMAPGWCDTELLRRGLPTFRRLLRPILRTPAQGADTVAWLLSRPPASTATSTNTSTSSAGASYSTVPADTTDRLWHDRRPRLEHRFPWTLAGATPEELWDWCERRTAPTGADL